MEFERLDGFPDAMDLGRWQGNHYDKCQFEYDFLRLSLAELTVGIAPLETETGRTRQSILLVEPRLYLVSAYTSYTGRLKLTGTLIIVSAMNICFPHSNTILPSK